MLANQDRRVLIVLGLYRPDRALLSRQLRSLVEQTHRNFEIFISPDGAIDVDSRLLIEGLGDTRIHILDFGTRLGVHRNFARGLNEALVASRSDTDLFAFCDQDDLWRPNKLALQVGCFAPGIALCHSDARVVSRAGDLIAPSLFQHESRSRSGSFADLLTMNSVTGMTAVFRHDVAQAARKFPLSGCRYILHDHWVALVASLIGGIHFIEEPLVEYTQHATNVLGARSWQGSFRARRTSSERRKYLRNCFRQFSWRRRALKVLRRTFAGVPSASGSLNAESLDALFDCQSPLIAGVSLSLRRRVQGEWRQADQIWRIWRGKTLYCASSARRRHKARHLEDLL